MCVHVITADTSTFTIFELTVFLSEKFSALIEFSFIGVDTKKIPKIKLNKTLVSSLVIDMLMEVVKKEHKSSTTYK